MCNFCGDIRCEQEVGYPDIGYKITIKNTKQKGVKPYIRFSLVKGKHNHESLGIYIPKYCPECGRKL